MSRRGDFESYPAVMLTGLLLAFAALLIGALVVTRNEPQARASAQLRQDLRNQEAFSAESRR